MQLEVSDCERVELENLFTGNGMNNNISTIILWNIQHLLLAKGGKVLIFFRAETLI